MTSSTALTSGTATPTHHMNVGVAGLGAGAVQVIRAMANAPYIQLMAAADVRPEALATFTSRFQGRTYPSVEALCRDPEVEVIWISTPNQFHCEHTVTAAQHGKHVVVEKPMALTLDEAQRMTGATEKFGLRWWCGHPASLMAANQAMRRFITSGAIGAGRPSMSGRTRTGCFVHACRRSSTAAL